MLKIRKAVMSEFEMVRDFYYSLIDATEDREYSAGWTKDVYPDDPMLIGAIEREELYIALLETPESKEKYVSALGKCDFVNGGIFTSDDEEVAGVMIVNHDCNDGYAEVDFPVKAEPHEVTVIHALGVHPKFAGRGLAKELVSEVQRMARENGQKAIRLDVLEGNLPAEKTYVAMGFEYIKTLEMYYEDTGWTNYMLYECPL